MASPLFVNPQRFVASLHFHFLVESILEEKDFPADNQLTPLFCQYPEGLIGGLTDTLQSLVLPPVIYLLEANRHRMRASADYEAEPSRGRYWRLEFAACVALALFGVSFIFIATVANLHAIISFMRTEE